MNAQSAAFVQQYRVVGAYEGVETADPHTLIGMLYDGLGEAFANAKGALLRGDVAGKGSAVVRAVDILEGLRVSLDADRGGDVAENLSRLYVYMQERLTQFNLNNDPLVVDELLALNNTLREAWADIPVEARSAVS